MPTAESARRTVPKATYVALQIGQQGGAAREVGRAVQKQALVRDLALQPGEVDAVLREGPTGNDPPVDGQTASLLRQFEGQPLASQLPRAAAFGTVPTTTLTGFVATVATLRTQALAARTEPNSGPVSPVVAAEPVDKLVEKQAAQQKVTATASVDLYAALPVGQLQIWANAAVVAHNSFQTQVAATPIGMLHLEQIEMTPAGIERGELIATIPLAPKERTAVVQKEWSVTTKEFTSIVTDSLDNYSETGVTENTELAQSTNSQVQHSNQFNVNATVSGSYAFVTATVSTSYGVQDSATQAIAASSKHAKETTQKASSRVKQEHKTTISTTTVTGSAETTTRTLENPSAEDPMRIDYFSMMRKWRVRLYRYGLRMTYDIAIPEPGATLRELFAQMDVLTQAIATPFVFGLRPDQVTRDNYLQLAADNGASVPEPPLEVQSTRLGGQVQGLGKLGDDEGWHFFSVPVDVPDNFEVAGVTLDAMIGNVGNDPGRSFTVFGYGAPPGLGNIGQASFVVDLTAAVGFLANATGSQQIVYFLQNVDAAAVTFVITFVPTPEAMAQWQLAVWQAVHDAARDAYYALQQQYAQELEQLTEKLNVDTLTLRREENDEIMKGVLRWLLGTGFEFMPKDVAGVFSSAGGDLEHGVTFTGNDVGISPAMWTTMYQYEEMVKFVNEAIEWENVLYFLYSYFWDVPLSWNFIRQIEHPDSTRQAFLRSGSARVVLPVRKGYEQAWLSFVELGDFGEQLPPDHPYMTIAQEIQAYDNTNYPGIAPANPGATPIEPTDMATTICSTKVAASVSPVTIAVDDSSGFAIGSYATIDTIESGVQEVTSISDVPDGTHLVLASLANAHDGSIQAFPIVQPGESGVIVAEWDEYTPTSGVDIAVTSNLATIA
jgi:hypothetical protein